MIKIRISTFQIFSIGIVLGILVAWTILMPFGIVNSDSILIGYKTVLTEFILPFSIIFIPAFILVFYLSFIASKWIDTKYPSTISILAIFLISMTILNISTIITTLCVLLYNYENFVSAFIESGYKPVYAVNLFGSIPVFMISVLMKYLRDNRME